MKVTFTCEKCGRVVYNSTLRDGCEQATYGPMSCLCQRKLTYGPLTEEMVAEAMARSCSHRFPEDGHDFAYMARFVLRLLEHMEHLNEARRSVYPHTGVMEAKDVATIYGKTPRDWLLKLAREP